MKHRLYINTLHFLLSVDEAWEDIYNIIYLVTLTLLVKALRVIIVQLLNPPQASFASPFMVLVGIPICIRRAAIKLLTTRLLFKALRMIVVELLSLRHARVASPFLVLGRIPFSNLRVANIFVITSFKFLTKTVSAHASHNLKCQLTITHI